MKEKKAKGKAEVANETAKAREWRPVTVYLASRNSSGVHERILRVSEGDRILGYLNDRFIPRGYLSEVGTSRDWRIAHCFFTREEAIADYIALEKARLRTAQDALKQIAA